MRQLQLPLIPLQEIDLETAYQDELKRHQGAERKLSGMNVRICEEPIQLINVCSQLVAVKVHVIVMIKSFNFTLAELPGVTQKKRQPLLEFALPSQVLVVQC